MIPELSEEHSNGQICFEQITALQTALEQGIFAISQNSLEQLEEHLWRQQLLCANLQKSVGDLKSTHVTKSTMEGILQAFYSLRTLNRTYAALIEQAQASTALLHQLCLAHSDSRAESQSGDRAPDVTGGLSCIA